MSDLIKIFNTPSGGFQNWGVIELLSNAGSGSSFPMHCLGGIRLSLRLPWGVSS